MSPNSWDMGPVYYQSGDPESEDNVTLQYPGQLGMRSTNVQPTRATPGAEAGRSKTYQVVRTDSTMSVSPFRGAVAWWSDKTQYLVTTSPTALGRSRIAGVFQNAPTKGNYTCIQIGGPAIVKFIDAVTTPPTAAGLFAIPSATAGKADCVSTAPAYAVLGLTASAYDAVNAEAVVDLDVPQTT